MPTIIRQYKLIPLFLCMGLMVACAGPVVRPEAPEPAPLATEAAPERPTPNTPVAVNQEQPEKAPQPAAPTPQYSDLWDKIRAGFSLPELNNDYVEYYKRWYQDRPEYLQRMTERATRYLHHIVAQVEKRGMPLEIALLPAIESAFKPNAYSHAHAAGLWQFIPATGRRYGLKQNWWYDGRRDVVAATDAALNYLSFLHQEFEGDWFLALAAYNAGEKRVLSAIRHNKKRGRPTDFVHLSLKSETRRYVPKLIAFKQIVLEPERYGVVLPPIPVSPYFAQVSTKGQIDLGVLAKQSGLKLEELYLLNPAFRRWATDPDGPHSILVPHADRKRVNTVVASLPDTARMRWSNYTIRSGDTLGSIARRYRVSVGAIQQANKLASTRIRAGHTLVIPMSAGPATSGLLASASMSAPRAQGKATGQVPVVHHVRSGDTLWTIARRYNVYVKQLLHWNEIRSNDILRLGQKLLIYRN